jgi:hypothetical protein
VFLVRYELDLYIRRNSVIRDKPIVSSERMLHKDYDRKCSVARKEKQELLGRTNRLLFFDTTRTA